MAPRSKRAKHAEPTASHDSTPQQRAPDGSHTVSTLEMLPRELVFAVVNYAPQSVKYLRRVMFLQTENSCHSYVSRLSLLQSVSRWDFEYLFLISPGISSALPPHYRVCASKVIHSASRRIAFRYGAMVIRFASNFELFQNNEAGRVHIIIGLPKTTAPLFELRFILRRSIVNWNTKIKRSGQRRTADKLTVVSVSLQFAQFPYSGVQIRIAGRRFRFVEMCCYCRWQTH